MIQDRSSLPDEWLVLTLLLIWGLFVYYWHLGTPLRGDEGMYAAIARTIVRTGNWFELFYEGRQYFNKPPLHFWQIALSQLVWGSNEFAIRFPSATFGLATMFLVYYCGTSLFHRRLGLVAALITTTTLATIWHAHLAKFDTAFAFWINLAFFAFFQAYRAGARRIRYLCLAFFSMGMGTMLKGPVAIVLPGVAAIAFLLITRRSKILREVPFLVTGLAILLLTTGYYYLMLGDAFNQHFFVSENLTRIYEGEKPRIFYFYMIFADFFPWSLFLPCAVVYLWRCRSRHLGEEELVLRVWAITFFVFLNVPVGKAERYLVLLIPPFGLLVARYWDHLFCCSERLSAVEDRLLRFTVALLAAGTLVLLFVGPWIVRMRYPTIPLDFWPMAFTLLIGIVCVAVGYAALKPRSRVLFPHVFPVAIAMTIGLIQYFYPALAQYESAKSIGQQVRAVVGDSPLVIYHPDRSLGEDILYYLDRPAPVPQLRAQDEIYTAFRSDGQVFGLVAKDRYEEFGRQGDLPLVRIADYSYRRRDFVLAANRGGL